VTTLYEIGRDLFEVNETESETESDSKEGGAGYQLHGLLKYGV